MAIVRYPVQKYATIELNHVSWPETGRVFAQLPLGEEFTKEKPCENGAWLVYDMVKGTAHSAEAGTDQVGVMMINEKEYLRPYIVGMNQYALEPDSFYPRIGMPAKGDLYTTNCFCYDDSEFEGGKTDVDTALKAINTTPLYLVPEAGQMAPKLTKTAPTAETATVAAKVVKFYTMPNGEPGIKVQFIMA